MEGLAFLQKQLTNQVFNSGITIHITHIPFSMDGIS